MSVFVFLLLANPSATAESLRFDVRREKTVGPRVNPSGCSFSHGAEDSPKEPVCHRFSPPERFLQHPLHPNLSSSAGTPFCRRCHGDSPLRSSSILGSYQLFKRVSYQFPKHTGLSFIFRGCGHRLLVRLYNSIWCIEIFNMNFSALELNV